MRILDYNLFSCWCWRPSITIHSILSSLNYYTMSKALLTTAIQLHKQGEKNVKINTKYY
uniref:Uncharacterized protein n=1 Tax=Heterorhabditis bacteriophora TaxID=37862 RepID=A0A1I7WM60_HETBA